MSRICWALPSGRILSAKKHKMSEEDARKYAELLPKVIFFYI